MSDEDELHQVHDAFARVWSAGDASGAAQFWTEDGVRVGAAGDTQRGREAIRAALERLFSGAFKGATVHVERGTMRVLGPGLALYQGRMQIRPGGERPPLDGYYLDVMTKIGGRWLILESHPKLFPSAQRATETR